MGEVVAVGPFLGITLGIIAVFLGKRLNDFFGFLREFNIPEPVTGGLTLAGLFGLIYAFSGVALEFHLGARDFLLVYFFTTIGINASLQDLREGGKPLLLLVGVTTGLMFLQNLAGVSVAYLFGRPPVGGMLGGTVALVGGHGTAIAWAPRIAEKYGIQNAMEVGIACATAGLILGSLAGGPIARFLITKHNLKGEGVRLRDARMADPRQKQGIGHLDFLDSVLAIHICVICGFVLDEAVEELGLKLPLYVTCLVSGIILTNIIPSNFPRLAGTRWPSRTPAMALIAEISLSTFLAMSLMSMRLWTLIDLAAPLLTLLSVQLVLTIAVVVLAVFPVMGRGYDASVISAGFTGIVLGSTPTAMANMAAVTQHFGPSRLAFIVVPLMGAFFIDLVNAMIIPLFLRVF